MKLGLLTAEHVFCLCYPLYLQSIHNVAFCFDDPPAYISPHFVCKWNSFVKIIWNNIRGIPICRQRFPIFFFVDLSRHFVARERIVVLYTLNVIFPRYFLITNKTSHASKFLINYWTCSRGGCLFSSENCGQFPNCNSRRTFIMCIISLRNYKRVRLWIAPRWQNKYSLKQLKIKKIREMIKNKKWKK